MNSNNLIWVFLSCTLMAVVPAQAITWEFTKNISQEPLVTLDSNVFKITSYGEIECEVGKPIRNPLKKRQWLRSIKCVKNGMEASATVGCEKGETDGVNFTFNEVKGVGYVSPFLGCK